MHILLARLYCCSFRAIANLCSLLPRCRR
jgi:hypothetical protein